jgi:hypothetical protein
MGDTMPRNVRNFWLELTVDGKTSRIETGPQAKDGGFSLIILQRDGGSITRAMEVDGRALSDGRLKLTAIAKDKGIEVITVR